MRPAQPGVPQLCTLRTTIRSSSLPPSHLVTEPLDALGPDERVAFLKPDPFEPERMRLLSDLTIDLIFQLLQELSWQLEGSGLQLVQHGVRMVVLERQSHPEHDRDGQSAKSHRPGPAQAVWSKLR